MQPSCGMIFIFLLARLQLNKSNTEGREVHEISNRNSSVKENNQSILPRAAATNPSNVSHAEPTIANAKKKVMERTEVSRQPSSTALRSTDGTTLSSNGVMVPQGAKNKSDTNSNRIPVSSATFTTMGDFSGVTKSAAATSTSTATPSNSIVTHSTPSAALLPSDNSSINSTLLFPTAITLTSPTAKQDSPTSNLNPVQHTTELNHNFSNPSTAPSNSTDVNKEKTNRAGVIAGVIVGAILGSILIGLIVYFICGKKSSESFSHRRLYDDTRSDPVLHLDNSLGPYDTSFGCATDDKTSRTDKAEEDNTGCPSDGIPMAEMSPSHPSP